MPVEGDSVWSKKGATLSDKSACKEFGLTQEEIITAIRKGKLQYRMNSIYGNPFLAQDRASDDAWQMNVRRKFFSARWKMPSRFSRREHT